jgi:peptidoglycan/xylan/chitin deacetylase (PgdA/CDA1 family)
MSAGPAGADTRGGFAPGTATRRGIVADQPGPATLPVLMYHSVSTVPQGPLAELGVPQRRLREHLGALTSAGYRLVGLSDALDLVSGGFTDPVVAVTFDDGYADFLDALPILGALGAGATLYPVVGQVGREADWLGERAGLFGRLLDWPELDEVAAAGVEIGCHGLTHRPLDVLPSGQVDEELRIARERLTDRYGRRIRSFCYPHGYQDAAVRAAVARHGYDNACVVGRALHTVGADRFAVPRLLPTPEQTGEQVVELVETGGPAWAARLRALAQPAWRLARRQVFRISGRTLT